MSSPERNSPPLPSPNATDRRRSSFSAAGFADFFARQNGAANSPGQNGTSPYPGPITSAAAQAQRRRLSLTTLGLSGASNQGSPFSTTRPRHESFSSNNSTGIDESPFEEEGDRSAASSSANQPNFARRLSFGARALRERQNTASAAGANVEGYNAADRMRSRAERGSISNQGAPQHAPLHERAKSVAVMEPPKEMPRTVQKAPDAVQERILRGDFYMD